MLQGKQTFDPSLDAAAAKRPQATMALEDVESLSDDEPAPKPSAKPKAKTKAKAKAAGGEPVPKPKAKSKGSTKATAHDPTPKPKAVMKKPAAKRPASDLEDAANEEAPLKRPASHSASQKVAVHKCRYKCGKFGFKVNGHERLRVARLQEGPLFWVETPDKPPKTDTLKQNRLASAWREGLCFFENSLLLPNLFQQLVACFCCLWLIICASKLKPTAGVDDATLCQIAAPCPTNPSLTKHDTCFHGLVG